MHRFDNDSPPVNKYEEPIVLQRVAKDGSKVRSEKGAAGYHCSAARRLPLLMAPLRHVPSLHATDSVRHLWFFFLGPNSDLTLPLPYTEAAWMWYSPSAAAPARSCRRYRRSL